jgi:hypothetical protein
MFNRIEMHTEGEKGGRKRRLLGLSIISKANELRIQCPSCPGNVIYRLGESCTDDLIECSAV